MRWMGWAAALLLSVPAVASAETYVYGLDYPGLSSASSAVPVMVSIASEEGGTFVVSLQPESGTAGAPQSVTISPGGNGDVTLIFNPLPIEGVVNATVVVQQNGNDVERYAHKFVVDYPAVTDAEVAASGVKTLDGRRITTAEQLAREFAPVLRLSTPGALGRDEAFLPKPVEAGFRSTHLERRHAVTGKKYVFTAFDQAPAAVLATNPGSNQFLDLTGTSWSRDSADQGVTLQNATTDLTPRIYATVVQSDGYLTVQYWTYWLYNDWSNDHESDWESLTIYFDGAEGALEPVAIAGSRHQDGTWRAWSKVPKYVDPALGATLHPIDDVANGGHGNYFWSGDDDAGPLGKDNHDGSLTQLLPAGLESLRPQSVAMDVQLLPRLSDVSDSSKAWVLYSGRWGYWDGSTAFLLSGTQGPPGPAFRAGAGVTSSRPEGEMWLWPSRWLNSGNGGNPLSLDGEGDTYDNATPHELSAVLTGDAPVVGGTALYTCEGAGVDRLGLPLDSNGLHFSLFAEGPDGLFSGTDVLEVPFLHGGELHVTCVAAEVEDASIDPRAYAEATSELVFTVCPAQAQYVEGKCECLNGYRSSDPSAVDCTPIPMEQPDAGSSADAGSSDDAGALVADAGSAPGAVDAGSSAGDAHVVDGGCSGVGADAFALLALGAWWRRRRGH